MPGSVFDGIKQAIVADRYAYFDDCEVRDQLFVSQPGSGGLERQDPVGGTVDH